MTKQSQRAISARPRRNTPEDLVAPIQTNIGDLEAKSEVETEAVGKQEEENRGEEHQWQEVQNKVEDLNVRMARYFEDANDAEAWKPPMIKTPLQPTKEEWMRHQLTHTHPMRRGVNIAYRRGL